jgi:uncharacterized protein (DUF305 family)
LSRGAAAQTSHLKGDCRENIRTSRRRRGHSSVIGARRPRSGNERHEHVRKALGDSRRQSVRGLDAKHDEGHERHADGNPDKDFVLMMMPHHQGAIDMAKVELQYGTDPEMRQLATDIISAQEKEIAQMKNWLPKHGK